MNSVTDDLFFLSAICILNVNNCEPEWNFQCAILIKEMAFNTVSKFSIKLKKVVNIH